jgi:outer membrane protein assembly factor BamB
MRSTTATAAVILSLATALFVSRPQPARAADWPNFRGPAGAGVSDERDLPVEWSDTQNVAWKAALPGPGSSSPIVAGDRVFLTCYSGYGLDRAKPGEPSALQRDLVCLSLADGKILWRQSVPATLPEDAYQGMLADHGYASHTAATDGQQVFVFFGRSGVVALDLEGHQQWRTSVGAGVEGGPAMFRFGSGASLTLIDDLVLVNANAESEAIVALSKQDGHEVWKTEAKGYRGSWSTPVLVDVGGKRELVVNLPDEIWGIDPADGGLLWYSATLKGAAATTVAAKDGVVFTLGGGPSGQGAAAVRAGGHGDVTESHLVWKTKVGSYVPSPIVVGDYLYWVDERGLACCLEAATGKQIYRERLPAAGSTYASLVAADGKLYAVTRRNGTFVLAAGPKFERLAHNKLDSDDSDFNASPAVASRDGRGGCLLLRSNRFLYCLAVGAASN